SGPLVPGPICVNAPDAPPSVPSCPLLTTGSHLGISPDCRPALTGPSTPADRRAVGCLLRCHPSLPRVKSLPTWLAAPICLPPALSAAQSRPQSAAITPRPARASIHPSPYKQPGPSPASPRPGNDGPG